MKKFKKIKIILCLLAVLGFLGFLGSFYVEPSEIENPVSSSSIPQT